MNSTSVFYDKSLKFKYLIYTLLLAKHCYWIWQKHKKSYLFYLKIKTNR